MRSITTHKDAGLNEHISINVLDGAGTGGASHWYVISGEGLDSVHVNFQVGGAKKSGLNGISNEALLAIVEDRLAGFQSGSYACTDNEIALNCVRGALQALHKRTEDRVTRGVEGELKV
jgi:hypothetical protein